MSNWEKRPLSAAQVAYAALDAYVLLPIFDDLTEHLGSRDWRPSCIKSNLVDGHAAAPAAAGARALTAPAAASATPFPRPSFPRLVTDANPGSTSKDSRRNRKRKNYPAATATANSNFS